MFNSFMDSIAAWKEALCMVVFTKTWHGVVCKCCGYHHNYGELHARIVKEGLYEYTMVCTNCGRSESGRIDMILDRAKFDAEYGGQ